MHNHSVAYKKDKYAQKLRIVFKHQKSHKKYFDSDVDSNS